MSFNCEAHNEPARSVCQECPRVLCEKCAKAHSSYYATATHQVKLLSGDFKSEYFINKRKSVQSSYHDPTSLTSSMAFSAPATPTGDQLVDEFIREGFVVLEPLPGSLASHSEERMVRIVDVSNDSFNMMDEVLEICYCHKKHMFIACGTTKPPFFTDLGKPVLCCVAREETNLQACVVVSDDISIHSVCINPREDRVFCTTDTEIRVYAWEDGDEAHPLKCITRLCVKAHFLPDISEESSYTGEDEGDDTYGDESDNTDKTVRASLLRGIAVSSDNWLAVADVGDNRQCIWIGKPAKVEDEWSWYQIITHADQQLQLYRPFRLTWDDEDHRVLFVTDKGLPGYSAPEGVVKLTIREKTKKERRQLGEDIETKLVNRQISRQGKLEWTWQTKRDEALKKQVNIWKELNGPYQEGKLEEPVRLDFPQSVYVKDNLVLVTSDVFDTIFTFFNTEGGKITKSKELPVSSGFRPATRYSDEVEIVDFQVYGLCRTSKGGTMVMLGFGCDDSRKEDSDRKEGSDGNAMRTVVDTKEEKESDKEKLSKTTLHLGKMDVDGKE